MDRACPEGRRGVEASISLAIDAPGMLRVVLDVLVVLVRGVHAAYVAFVVAAPFALVSGVLLSWEWLRAPWLRALHLACLAFAAVQHATGWACPLTVLENRLRGRPDDVGFLGDASALPASVVVAVVASYLALTAVAHVAASSAHATRRVRSR